MHKMHKLKSIKILRVIRKSVDMIVWMLGLDGWMDEWMDMYR